MSTKIYNGYEISGIRNIHDMHNFCMGMRRLMLEKLEELTAKAHANIIDSIYYAFANSDKDEIELHKHKFIRGERYFGAAWIILKDRFYESTNKLERDPLCDFSCEFVLFPMPESDRILATLYSQKKELTEIWESHAQVDEFYYWDNTDQPEGMSYELWEQRGEDWESVLPDYSVPANSGFTFSCIGSMDMPIPNREVVAKYMDSHEVRVRRVAKDKLFRNWEKPEINGGNVMSIFRDFREYLKTEEGAAALEEEIKTCQPDVPESLIAMV